MSATVNQIVTPRTFKLVDLSLASKSYTDDRRKFAEVVAGYFGQPGSVHGLSDNKIRASVTAALDGTPAAAVVNVLRKVAALPSAYHAEIAYTLITGESRV